MTDTLWPDLVPLELTPADQPKVSTDRRRTMRQRADVEAGRHPLTRGRLAADPAAKCGNCRFRVLFEHHRKSYPKCTVDGSKRMTHSVASDVRAWWPGCADHEWGDPKLSPDAARSGPAP